MHVHAYFFIVWTLIGRFVSFCDPLTLCNNCSYYYCFSEPQARTRASRRVGLIRHACIALSHRSCRNPLHYHCISHSRQLSSPPVSGLPSVLVSRLPSQSIPHHITSRISLLTGIRLQPWMGITIPIAHRSLLSDHNKPEFGYPFVCCQKQSALRSVYEG